MSAMYLDFLRGRAIPSAALTVVLVACGAIDSTAATLATGVPSDSVAWSTLPYSTQGAREAHTAIYDRVGDRIVVFGGRSNYRGDFDDVWALTLSDGMWAKLAPAGPSPGPREMHTAIYDPVRQQMIVYGGYGAGAGDVWSLALDGSPAWTKLAVDSSASTPGARNAHSAIYDPRRDRMIVFGGVSFTDGSSNPWHNDVWALRFTEPPRWERLLPAGVPPSGREGQSAIYDPDGDRMIVFGSGGEFQQGSNDTWALSFSGGLRWTQLTPSGALPPERCFHNAVYDSAGRRMLIFGGVYLSSFGEVFNDIWALSLGNANEWRQLVPGDLVPNRRWFATAVFDPIRYRMVVDGGWNHGIAGDAYDDTWALALARDARAVVTPADWMAAPAPNPTRGPCSMRGTLTLPGHLEVGVFDLNGRRVRGLVDADRDRGAFDVTWDGMSDTGARVRPGLYFVKSTNGRARAMQKVVIVP